MYYAYPMSECRVNNIRPGDIYADGFAPYSTWVLVTRDYLPVVGYARDFRIAFDRAIDTHDINYFQVNVPITFYRWNGECYVQYERIIPIMCINPENVPCIDKIPWYRQVTGRRFRVALGDLVIPWITKDWHFAISRSGCIIDYCGKYYAPRNVFSIFYATNTDLSDLTGFTVKIDRIGEYVYRIDALRTNPLPHLGWVVYPRVAECSITVEWDKLDRELYLKDFKYNTWES